MRALTLCGPTLIASAGWPFPFSWPIVLAADTAAGGGLLSFIFIFAPLFAIWYFLVIRPQQGQRRKTQEMLASLKTGDRVVTTGGIHGTVVGFRNSVVQLQVAAQVRIDVERSAVSRLVQPEGDGKTEASGGREPSRREAAAKGKR